ncbi:MAG TPA: hypothetical protein VFN67_34255 [Polyangiales bacterium]|nr:hypothetical protein [Polyangiales bacterium]
MTNDVVPEVVRKLIAERIDSIPELEAILLLRQYREKSWSVNDAGQALYVSATVATHVLNVLTERGFLACENQQFRYAPEDPDLEANVTLLASTYSKHLIAVTNIVHAKPSASVRLFAQAFRFRKDK